ncbi:hypothetical protein K402DRAFT_343921 [Aulographum hederae CBS 113979]|uniref:Zn(2)-C6 fungal-type domain-containing protein n=1 Tax=Aulographum hederae CBS 113979 TaxID=1176131 RepID=A0A6G1GII8_9PEZI|nr:hypothetical protein K402DRAFT_343921 [Aulographum hederae CBS 113979]
MPPSRTSKLSREDRRVLLSSRIQEQGFVEDMPCSNCERQNIECRSSPNSNSCAECVRRGLSSCDLVVLPSTCEYFRFLPRSRY